MSIAVRWKQGPLVGMSLMIVGLSICIEIPRLVHSQFILIIDKPLLLVAATVGMVGVSIAGITLVMESLMKRWRTSHRKVIKPLLYATGVSSAITYLSYFIGLQAFHVILSVYVNWLEVHLWSYLFSLSLAGFVTVLITHYISRMLVE